MRDGVWFTDSDTGCWFITVAGVAGSAAIPDFFSLRMFYKDDGFLAEDVDLVRPHLEDFGRTDFRALAAPSALIRVDDDIPVAGPVLKTIIGYHNSAPLSVTTTNGLRVQGFKESRVRVNPFPLSV